MISFSLRAVLRHLPTHSESAHVAPSIIADLVFFVIPQCQPLLKITKTGRRQRQWSIYNYYLFVRLSPLPSFFAPPPPPPHTHIFGGVGLTSYFITTIVNHPVFCVLHFWATMFLDQGEVGWVGVANNEGGEGTNKRTRIYNIYTGERGWHLRVWVGWVGGRVSYRPSQMVKENEQTDEKKREKTRQNKIKQDPKKKKKPNRKYYKNEMEEGGWGI